MAERDVLSSSATTATATTTTTTESLPNFAKFEVQILTTCTIAFLSPLLAFLSLFSDSFNADNSRKFVESVFKKMLEFPFMLVREGRLLLKELTRKVVVGMFAAVYVYVILVLILALSFVLGVGWVQRWVEKPVNVREYLHFDYTQDHPSAVVAFGRYKHNLLEQWPLANSKVNAVPIGHTFYVSVLLLLPESDYNRDIGIFQLTAEIISSNGKVIEKASYPCMLQYKAWPIRMIRTFVMGLPLLLGIIREAQTIEVAMLRHKEGFPRSAGVRIILSPRAGTNFVPQLYEAEILLSSKLPWLKEKIRGWKWSFCVWTSMSIYPILVLLALLFFRSVMLPVFSRTSDDREQDMAAKIREDNSRETSEVSMSMSMSMERMPRGRTRGKRKATPEEKDELQIAEPAAEESCATSMTLTGDESTTVASTSLKEESGDSESAPSVPQ